MWCRHWEVQQSRERWVFSKNLWRKTNIKRSRLIFWKSSSFLTQNKPVGFSLSSGHKRQPYRQAAVQWRHHLWSGAPACIESGQSTRWMSPKLRLSHRLDFWISMHAVRPKECSTNLPASFTWMMSSTPAYPERNTCPISGLFSKDSASINWSSTRPSASSGCPLSTSLDTASPKSLKKAAKLMWSSMKLLKPKPWSMPWTGPQRETWPLGAWRMLWLMQQCWLTYHPTLPSPSTQTLQTMSWHSTQAAAEWCLATAHFLQPAAMLQKYSTFCCKLLGLYLAIRHFRFLLEAREFTPFVDHKPLTLAMAKVTEPWYTHHQRQLSYISEFTINIQNVARKKKKNLVADCLSQAIARPP